MGIDGGGLNDLLGVAVQRRGSSGSSGQKPGSTRRCLSSAKARRQSCATSKEVGELVIYDEFGQDIADIAQLAQRVDDKGQLYAVALDPYGVGAIVDALDEVSISGENRIVGILQGWKLTGAIKTAERKLADGSLRHSGQ
jgi:phage terminase large subunit-like protein